MTTFAELGVPADLVSVLERDGKTEAFPIQRQTLPDALAGRDVLGRGRTGSGKTIAFSLPLVSRIGAAGRVSRPRAPRALVLAPTRELATQIAATIQPLAAASGLRVTTVFGGVSQRPQEQALERGVDIVVACPGRLEDLLKQGVLTLDAIEVTVLDEADHMADLGFLPVVTRIMRATPQNGQRLLFSATLDGGVDTLVKRFLHDEVRHSVDEASVPQGEMIHRVFVTPDADAKTEVVRHLASGTGRRILFTRTKHQAKKLAKKLTAAGIPAVELQGNLSQNARDRNLAAFGEDPARGGVRVLVATDVAARGVHVDGVELVVHVDPPAEHKAYLHRSGRTARAGATGTVVTLATEDQRRDVKDILRKAKITAELESVVPGDTAISDLVGDQAPYVAPVASAPSGGSGAAGRSSRGPRAGAPASAGGGGRNRSRGHRNDAERQSGDGAARQPGHSSTGAVDSDGQQPGSARRRGRSQRARSQQATRGSAAAEPRRAPTTGATVDDIRRANAARRRSR